MGKKTGKKTLENDLNAFFEKRKESAIAELYNQSDYILFADKYTELSNEIRDKVSFDLIDRLNTMSASLQRIETDAAYKQGLKDGLRLVKILGDGNEG